MTDPRRQIAPADVARFRDLAVALADEARRRIRGFLDGGFEVKTKPDGSYVTSADLDVEKRQREMIASSARSTRRACRAPRSSGSSTRWTGPRSSSSVCRRSPR